MNWSERIQWREKVHDQYPDLWDLKLVRKEMVLSALFRFLGIFLWNRLSWLLEKNDADMGIFLFC